ncbi:MAG: hypothetical protein HYV77_04470 [Candidatus Wildermuthbacteria bacterium]|nr:hypothetical protein [Candidatus Wildermuthbacteria bacterium]
MGKKSPFPKSTRKFIRSEKARIRRTFGSLEEQRAKIAELYARLAPKVKQTETGEVKAPNAPEKQEAAPAAK